MLDAWSERPDAFPAEVRAAYAAQFCDPATLHAVCEEYRAAATLDCAHDEADRGHRRIACPVLVLWSHRGAVARWYDPLAVWRAWADDVRGEPVAAGHFFPEEAPEETARQLLAFLAGPRGEPTAGRRGAPTPGAGGHPGLAPRDVARDHRPR